MKYMLIVIIFTAGGAQRDQIEGIDNLKECAARARAITGDTRKTAEYVFQSPDGRAMALCRPGATP